MEPTHVTVIMPIRNEARTIEQSLCAVLRQDYPKEFLQILIIDGDSSDGTSEIVEELIKKDPRVSVLTNPAKIVSTGMNIGIKHSIGDLIIRVDGHTIISPSYVRGCVEEWHRTKADNVGGRMNAQGRNEFGRAVAAATSSVFGVGDARFHYSNKEEYVDSVYMGAWPRSLFVKLGGFDEELIRNQDDEFNYRIGEAGGKILLSPRIKSTYFVRSSPISLWRQYFQYGFWKIRVLQKHPRMMKLRQFVPALFLLSLLLCGIIAILIKDFSLLKIILLTYLSTNLIFSILMGIKTRIANPILLPLVFAILHLSYGTGFLSGCVYFATKWDDRNGKVPLIDD